MTFNLTVNPSTPSKVIFTTEPPSSGTAGTALTNFAVAVEDSHGNIETTPNTGSTDTVTLSIASGPSGGTFTSAPSTYTSVAASNGTATFSGVIVDAAGSYTFTATDTSRSIATATSTPATVVSRAGPTLSASGPSSGTAGTAIPTGSITATLGASSGTNTSGAITFKVFGPGTEPSTCTSGGTTVGTATVNNGNATYNASSTYTPPSAGNYWWYASYGGDGNNNTAVSACGTGMSETVVGKASPGLSLSAPGTDNAGTAIANTSVSATLSGGVSPSGSITFYVFGPQSSAPTSCPGSGTSLGTATVTANGAYSPTSGVSNPAAGDYWWYASYNGDGNNAAAATTCGAGMSETVVSKLTPILSASGPSTGTTGATIATASITATLNSGDSPTGTITFKVFGPQSSAPTTCTAGTTWTGNTATVSGNGTYSPTSGYTPTQPGDYWWYASYGGDSNNNAASSACATGMSETVVSQASPTLSSSATSSGTAGTAIATAGISALLSGGYNPTGTVTFTVFGPLASAPTTCTSGGTTWTGNTATVSGDATYHPTNGFTPSQAGDYWWYASYGGDANNNTASSTCGSGMSETVVAAATPTVSTTGPGTGTAGTAIAASSVSSVLGATSGVNATGTITFTVFGPQASAPTTCTSGGTTVGAATVSGNNTYHPSAGFTPTGAGNYWWYASYGGDTNNNTASSTCGSGMSSTVVVKASPILTGNGSVDRHRRGDRYGHLTDLGVRVELGLQRDGHHQLLRRGSTDNRPDELFWWDSGRCGDRGVGQRDLQPHSGLHDHHAG